MPDLVPENLVHSAMLIENDRPESAALLVRWLLPPELAGRLVQVYLARELVGSTEDPAQRELLIAAPADPGWPAVDLAVLAVEPAEAGDDFSHLLMPSSRGGRVRLCWPRTNNVPPGSTLNVFGNAGSGEINLAVPLNERPIEWWPDGVGQWGFGLAGFGEADFGGDCNDDPPGFGVGPFAMGQFGFDAEWASWLSGPLLAGEHRFAVVVRDDLGNDSPASPEAAVAIISPPPRAAGLAVAGDADQLVISWN